MPLKKTKHRPVHFTFIMYQATWIFHPPDYPSDSRPLLIVVAGDGYNCVWLDLSTLNKVYIKVKEVP